MRKTGIFSTYNRVIAMHVRGKSYVRNGVYYVREDHEVEEPFDMAKSHLGHFGAGEAPFIQRLVQLADCDATNY